MKNEALQPNLSLRQSDIYLSQPVCYYPHIYNIVVAYSFLLKRNEMVLYYKITYHQLFYFIFKLIFCFILLILCLFILVTLYYWSTSFMLYVRCLFNSFNLITVHKWPQTARRDTAQSGRMYLYVLQELCLMRAPRGMHCCDPLTAVSTGPRGSRSEYRSVVLCPGTMCSLSE